MLHSVFNLTSLHPEKKQSQIYDYFVTKNLLSTGFTSPVSESGCYLSFYFN